MPFAEQKAGELRSELCQDSQQVAVYTFKHAFIGKANQAAGTAAAHVRYITRKSATVAIASEGMPRHRHAVQRYMDEREASIRKNGRVCDKFIIALPKEMDQAQALHTLRRFGNRISQRWDSPQQRLLKGSYFLTLQDWDSHNPHCHFVFIDADRESGERVFGTTRKGSTERLRATWEEVCNGELERLGFEERIDRRPQHVIEAEKAEHLTSELGTPNLSVETPNLTPPDAPTDCLPESPEHAHADEPEPYDGIVQLPEQDMANSASRVAQLHPEEPTSEGPARIVAGPAPVSIVAKVRGAYQLSQRLKEAQGQRRQLTTALDWRERYEERSTQAAEIAGRLNTAEKQFERDHTNGYFNGKADLRGIRLPSWSILPRQLRGWQSKARKEAVAAQESVEELRVEHGAAERNANSAKAVHVAQVQHTAKLAAEVPGHPDYAWMNSDQQRQALGELEEAENVVQATRQGKLDGVTAEGIWEAYKAEEITLDEARDAAQVLGFDELTEHLAREAEQEQEEELGAE